MYKIHKPHLNSGYIAKVSLIEIRTENDEADWRMRYTPGLKAYGEHKAANDKPKLPTNRKDLFKEKRKNLKSENQPPLLAEVPLSKDEVAENLISQLKSYGIAETTARELVKSHRIAVEAQIRAYPYREGGKPKTNQAGWLIAAIKANYELPLAYLEAEEQKQTAQKAKQAKAARESCELCDANGYRRIFNDRYPNGAMKRCTHDPEVENKIPSRQQK